MFMKFILNIHLSLKILLVHLCGLSTLASFSCSESSQVQLSPQRALFEKIENQLVVSPKQKQKISVVLTSYRQKENYILLIIEHHRKNLYKEILSKNPDQNKVADLNRFIADEQYHLECLAAQKLFDLKKICNAKQLEKLNFIVAD